MTPVVGIYGIFIDDNTCLYVGQSQDIQRRFRTHRSELKRGVHHQRELQELHDTGIAFFYRVLEFCDPFDLSERESHYFDTLNPLCWSNRPPSRGNPYASLSGERACAGCGGMFTAYSRKRIYCSIDCKNSARSQEKICAQCGKTYESTSNSTTCSTQCYLSFQAVEVTCPSCGEQFMSNGRAYCSKRCNPSPVHEQECVVCGKAFTSARKIASYCSHACRHKRTWTITCHEEGCEVVFEARHANARYCDLHKNFTERYQRGR